MPPLNPFGSHFNNCTEKSTGCKTERIGYNTIVNIIKKLINVPMAA